MKDLLARTPKPPSKEYDPDTLYYRRVTGLEFRYHPENSSSKILVQPPGGDFESMPILDAFALAALGTWKQAEQLEQVASKKLWQWSQSGRVNFSRRLESACLTYGSINDEAQGLRLRKGVWPNLALEDLVQISPIPFMPRRTDLEHSSVVGMRFAVRERGHEVMGLTITGSEKLGQKLQHLVTKLNARSTWQEIYESCDQMDQNLLKALREFGLLAESPDPESSSRLRETKDAQVTWLGHASVLIQMNDVNLLVDPLFFASSDPESPKHKDRPFDPHQLPNIDAVLITHADNDHFNPNSLALLPRTTRIIVPRLAEPPEPYQVDIRGLLKCLGFENIVEMAPWSEVVIEDVNIVACPFEGENWGLILPQITYLIHSPAGSVYCSADSHLMPETFEKLKKEYPPVDIAFMGISGCAEPYAVDARFGYGNFYRDWIPSSQHNEWVQHCMGPKDVCEMLKIFEPNKVFGYAAGGADFIETSYSDVGSHQELVRCLGEQKTNTLPVNLQLGLPVLLTELRK